MKSSCLIVVAATLVAVGFGYSQPEITIYESEGYGNDYIPRARKVDSRVNVPDLTVLGIKNSRLHHCTDGAWLGYPEINYKGENPSVLALPTCRQGETWKTIKSLEVIGSPDNFTISSFNVFPSDYMNGGQTTFYTQQADLSSVAFNSFVLLGVEPVELFVSKNFQGLSICIPPGLGWVYTYDNFVNNRRDSVGSFLFNVQAIIGIEPSNIKSFRFGCSKPAKSLTQLMLAGKKGSPLNLWN